MSSNSYEINHVYNHILCTLKQYNIDADKTNYTYNKIISNYTLDNVYDNEEGKNKYKNNFFEKNTSHINEQNSDMERELNDQDKILNEHLGSKIISEVFQIFKHSSHSIIQSLVEENIKLKNEIRQVYSYMEILQNKTEQIAFHKNQIQLEEESRKESNLPFEEIKFDTDDLIMSMKEKVKFY
jgi:formyltetrahydrofolate synthetase